MESSTDHRKRKQAAALRRRTEASRRVGLVLGSGVVVIPDGLPAAGWARSAWTWRCPICGAELTGLVRECLRCNAEIVDPDALDRRDSRLEFLADEGPGGSRIPAVGEELPPIDN